MKTGIGLLYTVIILTCAAYQVGIAEEPENPPAGTSIMVYTTASGTNLRLQQTGVLKFDQAAQPLETEVAVFVNRDKVEFITHARSFNDF